MSKRRYYVLSLLPDRGGWLSLKEFRIVGSIILLSFYGKKILAEPNEVKIRIKNNQSHLPSQTFFSWNILHNTSAKGYTNKCNYFSLTQLLHGISSECYFAYRLGGAILSRFQRAGEEPFDTFQWSRNPKLQNVNNSICIEKVIMESNFFLSLYPLQIR